MLGAWLWGMLLGTAGGFLVGLLTANADDPHQATIRDLVHRVYREARQAAEEEERSLWREYERLTGITPE